MANVIAFYRTVHILKNIAILLCSVIVKVCVLCFLLFICVNIKQKCSKSMQKALGASSLWAVVVNQGAYNSGKLEIF